MKDDDYSDWEFCVIDEYFTKVEQTLNTWKKIYRLKFINVDTNNSYIKILLARRLFQS